MYNALAVTCLTLAAAACATPSTTIVAPPCAVFDGADPAELKAPNALVVDNTLAFPFSSRTVHVRYPDGVVVDEDVVFNEQESYRFAYAGCLTCGGVAVLGAGALLANDGVPDDDPAAVATLVIGAGWTLGGLLSPLTGWRASPTKGVLEDRCSEHHRKEVAPPSSPAPAPSPPAPPPAPPASSPAPDAAPSTP